MPGARLVVETDGGSRGTPGPAGYGALVRDPATGRVTNAPEANDYLKRTYRSGWTLNG